MTDVPDLGGPNVRPGRANPGWRAPGRDPATRRAAAIGRARIGPAIQVASLAAVIGIGGLLRLAAALSLSPHVDEASSVLAAHAVASTGLPILPSGTVYFQGATLSWLLAPFVWLGAGSLQDLHLMRLVLVVAGTLTVYLAYRLGQAVTGDTRVGMLMAAFVAVDPVSVQWSGHVRMYGLLQALTLGLAWAFVDLLDRGPSRRRAALAVVLAWAAVFTHVGACLLILAMALAAWLVFRKGLARRPDVLVTLALSGLAPMALLAANQLLGTASVSTDGPSSSFLTFVGDNLIQPLARFQVSFDDWRWTMLVRQSTLAWLVPGLIVATCAIVSGRRLLNDARDGASTRLWRATIVLLAFYWLPVVAVGLLTVSPKERYLLHVHLIGYFFVAVLIVDIARRPVQFAGAWRRWRPIASSVITAVAVLAIASGLAWRFAHPVVHPNYHTAMAYVAQRHDPGQPVIVALPAIGYLALDAASRPDLRFLAGDEDRPRAQRYTRRGEEGRLIDYWVGVDSIVTANELRRVLAQHPDAWIVVDDERLAADWAYAGDISGVLREMTTPVFYAPGGALVLRVMPPGR